MKYAIVYVICIVCLFGVGVLIWCIATPLTYAERELTMTLQTLVESWKTSGAYNSVEDPATEAGIKKAEATIGAQLPTSLREVYQLFNGGWIWELDFYQLDLNEHGFGLVNANEKYIEWGWHIPKEIRLFAGDGGGGGFGIWLLACGNPIYNHPIIEVGELAGEEGCMGIAGTNLISFLRGWSAFHLVMEEDDELWKVELGEDKDAPNRLKRIQTFLDTLEGPQSFRAEHHHEDPDENFAQLRKWADPQLPDPSGDSYNQQYTITDLKRIFGESK